MTDYQELCERFQIPMDYQIICTDKKQKSGGDEYWYYDVKNANGELVAQYEESSVGVKHGGPFKTSYRKP